MSPSSSSSSRDPQRGLPDGLAKLPVRPEPDLPPSLPRVQLGAAPTGRVPLGGRRVRLPALVDDPRDDLSGSRGERRGG